MAKKESVKKMMGFELVNPDKVHRAIHGSIGKGGLPSGGVGEGAPDEKVIAEYDRLGGLIRKDGNKVKMGCFYDFAAKKAIENPKVMLIFRDISGVKVEIEDGKKLPVSVEAAKMVDESKKPKKKVKELE